MFARSSFSSPDRRSRSSSPVWPLPALDSSSPIVMPQASKAHGIDLAYEHTMPAFIPVFAVADGVISHAARQAHGHAMVIDHRNGWATYYLNLEHMFARPTSATSRARPARVKAGDVLGYVGAPSKDAPRCLHFQLWKRDASGQFEPIAPIEYMQSWVVLPWFAERTTPSTSNRIAA